MRPSATRDDELAAVARKLGVDVSEASRAVFRRGNGPAHLYGDRVRGDSRVQQQPGVRLAELVAALSLAVDLGLGQPMEHVLRSTLISRRLAEDLGLDESDRTVVYYVGLLAWVGCHSSSYEFARLFADDIAARAGAYEHDLAGMGAARYLLRHVGAGRSLLGRIGAFGSFAAGSRRPFREMDATFCVIAGEFARRLGLGDEVHDALLHCFERWDGNGGPTGVKGEAIALPARIAQLTDVTVVWYQLAGVEGAIEVARRRRGTQFDPELVDRLRRMASRWFAEIEEASTWESVIDAEPALRPTLSDAELDRAFEAIADFADLKSPWFTGHSRAVARLAGDAASGCGLPDAETVRVRRTALVEDLGRLGVSNAIWDKPGPLSEAEWERVRLHPYLAQRVLARPPELQELGKLAVLHHERLDGSGYPRGLTAAALPPAARVLAAADCYQALLEPRPHRPRLEPRDAAAELRTQVRAGRLDGDAVDAVLAAAGHRVRRRREWPAGLTAREVEVLRLLARGASNRTIAQQLTISPKTAGSHIEHIYLKTGARSRVAASLFAMRHGLLDESTRAEA